MGQRSSMSAITSRSSSLPDRPWGYHPVGRDPSFGALDCVCLHGAGSPVAEGSYPRARIAVMLGGAFHARSSQGAAVVGAGALVLGNAGASYEFRHLDDGGDRSLVFDYDAGLLEELGPSGFRRVAVPPSSASAPVIALARRALCSGDPEDLRDAALAVASVAIASQHGERATSSAQERQISHVLRYIEAHYADDCSLETLAASARLSIFHFARAFRAITGNTPRQVVIATRLRAAAALLHTTHTPIIDIALEVGFGDLSHFTTSFARAFGVSPGAYRRGS
jgi:AraC family transcriptional regulator